eukprot:scaffold94243_cov26-Cyclotella_meneghiniana.AAC.2
MHKLLLVHPEVLDDIKLRSCNRTLPASSGEGEGEAIPYSSSTHASCFSTRVYLCKNTIALTYNDRQIQ